MKEVGNRYPLIPGKTGFLFRKGKELSEIVQSIVSGKSDDFKYNDFKRVTKDFDLKKNSNRVYDIYKSVLR